LLDGLKNYGKLFVVFFLEGVDLPCKFPIAVHKATQLYEGAHNGDIDLSRPLAPQDAGKHGDALFREGHGRVPQPHAVRFGDHIL